MGIATTPGERPGLVRAGDRPTRGHGRVPRLGRPHLAPQPPARCSMGSPWSCGRRRPTPTVGSPHLGRACGSRGQRHGRRGRDCGRICRDGVAPRVDLPLGHRVRLVPRPGSRPYRGQARPRGSAGPRMAASGRVRRRLGRRPLARTVRRRGRQSLARDSLPRPPGAGLRSARPLECGVAARPLRELRGVAARVALTATKSPHRASSVGGLAPPLPPPRRKPRRRQRGLCPAGRWDARWEPRRRTERDGRRCVCSVASCARAQPAMRRWTWLDTSVSRALFLKVCTLEPVRIFVDSGAARRATNRAAAARHLPSVCFGANATRDFLMALVATAIQYAVWTLACFWPPDRRTPVGRLDRVQESLAARAERLSFLLRRGVCGNSVYEAVIRVSRREWCLPAVAG